jgi:O-antigen/teichoic acid export membrane protein
LSLKRNIAANYAGQIYVTAIGIILVPQYVRYMGAEAYGLVGFYTMLQGWFQLLDIGLTPTIVRETSRYRGGAIDALALRRLLRALEGIFVSLALIGAGAIIINVDFVATAWLKVQSLDLTEVRNSIFLIALIIALRWVCGLYRGAINGFESLVWLNSFNVGIATLRFGAVLPVLAFIGASPTIFFLYQLAIAFFELVLLALKTYQVLPVVNSGRYIPWEWKPLRNVLKFSLTVAFTGAIWVFTTQSDKLLLSNVLTLSDYAYFTLAVLVASGITTISGPISVALLPRLTKLNAEQNEEGVLQLYRNATQLVAVIAIPATLMLALFSHQVLLAWTGNYEIAAAASPVLTLYSIGNGILVLAAFPYYLQFSKGDMKLHLIGNVIFFSIFVPTLLYSVKAYGMVGAGYTWIIANLIPFLFWVPVVHKKFYPGLHLSWMMRDVFPIVLCSATLGFLASKVITWPNSRVLLIVYLCVLGGTLFTAAVFGSPAARNILKNKWVGKRLEHAG